ncbi:hypothetical protein QTP88_015190 [Uroleucon formosanum]
MFVMCRGRIIFRTKIMSRIRYPLEKNTLHFNSQQNDYRRSISCICQCIGCRLISPSCSLPLRHSKFPIKIIFLLLQVFIQLRSKSTVRIIIVKRKKIQKHAIEGSNNKKSKSINYEDINVWFLNILPKLKEKYASKDVFNATEFELYYKLMPNKLLGFKNKLSRKHLKVLICANSDGTEKLNPFVIGKPLKH